MAAMRRAAWVASKLATSAMRAHAAENASTKVTSIRRSHRSEQTMEQNTVNCTPLPLQLLPLAALVPWVTLGLFMRAGLHAFVLEIVLLPQKNPKEVFMFMAMRWRRRALAQTAAPTASSTVEAPPITAPISSAVMAQSRREARSVLELTYLSASRLAIRAWWVVTVLRVEQRRCCDVTRRMKEYETEMMAKDANAI